MVSIKGLRHTDGEALTVLRGGDPAGFLGIGEVAAFHQHGGPALAAEDVHESGTTDSPVLDADRSQQAAVDPPGEADVLGVEAVVGMPRGRVVGVLPGDRGRHSGRSEAVGLEAFRGLAGEGGIEVEAHEEFGAAGFGDPDAVGQGEVDVVGPGEGDGPTLGLEQRLEATGPIEGELLLEPVAGDDACAGVDPRGKLR